MVVVAIVVVVVFLLLCVAELLWRRRVINPEHTRKFVHITVGSFVAFWPLFLSREAIVGLSVAFAVVAFASMRLKIFTAIHSVERPTWGEVFFALAVGVLAYAAQSGWIYTAALLHMSLADGLAALVGSTYGKRTRYQVFGQEKTVIGTTTFALTSVLIFAGYFAFATHSFSWWFVPITLAAAVIENVAVRGLDNLLVPLFIALGLNLIH